MAGGTPEHSRLSVNVQGELRNALRGRRCTVFNSDVRVRVLATGLGTYPDATVVCGRLEVDPEDKNTVTNPIVIVEVLSDSTETYDRDDKRAHYRQLPTLRDYLLVSQHERRIEHYHRNDDGTVEALRDVARSWGACGLRRSDASCRWMRSTRIRSPRRCLPSRGRSGPGRRLGGGGCRRCSWLEALSAQPRGLPETGDASVASPDLASPYFLGAPIPPARAPKGRVRRGVLRCARLWARPSPSSRRMCTQLGQYPGMTLGAERA